MRRGSRDARSADGGVVHEPSRLAGVADLGRGTAGLGVAGLPGAPTWATFAFGRFARDSKSTASGAVSPCPPGTGRPSAEAIT